MDSPGIKISGLPAVGTLTGAEIAPVVQNGVTSQLTLAQMIGSALFSLKNYNAVGDGVTNDTVAIAAAVAAAGAASDQVFVPGGTYVTTQASTDLNGPFWGTGQIKDTQGKRAPWFSAVKAAPSVIANSDSILTAFDGDLSKVQIAMEHRITGAASLGQPTTGYYYLNEAYPNFTYLFNTSGHNEATGSNDGRTAAIVYRVKLFQGGQGDCVAFNATGIATGAKAGATDFLANPAATIINGSLTAGNAGVYLNPEEFSLSDGGFDVAGIGIVRSLNRTIASSALNTYWGGARIQSLGAVPVDDAYYAFGKFSYGLNFAHADFGANQAAIVLEGGQRVYGDVTSGANTFRVSSLGSAYFSYESSAWNFVGQVKVTTGLTFADASNIVVNATTGTKIGTATTQKLSFWNATPVVQPTAVADASGGATVDAEARTALNALLARMRTIGAIAT